MAAGSSKPKKVLNRGNAQVWDDGMEVSWFELYRYVSNCFRNATYRLKLGDERCSSIWYNLGRDYLDMYYPAEVPEYERQYKEFEDAMNGILR